MVDVKALVPQLQKQVEFLTEDLINQATNVDGTATFLRDEYRKAIDTGRLSQSYEEWSEDVLEQVAVSWVLSCVFVRFLEDNHLIDECWIAGNGDRGKLADGSHEIFFRSHPHKSDRDYLKFVFQEVGKIPATQELFLGKTVTLWAVDPSGDAARRLLLFFKEIDAEQGGLKRWFGTGAANSRQTEYRDGVSYTLEITQVALELAKDTQFLGDVYQDLSEHARKKYALLQTPEFVQQFILDRTLSPAINEFGLTKLKLIDPACGSGHFLLGAFDRLFALWMKSDEVRGNPVVAAQNAFDSIFGVDINPFAIAITRFRMLVAAVRACGINRLHQQSYAWKLNLAVGDSLLRGSRPSFGLGRQRIVFQQEIEFEPNQKLRMEDPKAANEILDQGYHVVVGNPPYIIVRDRAQNAAYRQVYSTCHQKYSLGVPFTQRFWDLALRNGERIDANAEAISPTAGHIGMITANSFMKREFGKKLIEDFFAKIELTHVIDTSGAYIPGHGTPTVILFGRHHKATENPVRAVMGIKGEPTTPTHPAQGLVWRSILHNISDRDLQDEFTSSADVPRETYNIHPWSIGGGGAVDLLEFIEAGSSQVLFDSVDSIGITSFTLEDDVYILPRRVVDRQHLNQHLCREMVVGDMLRDWHGAECDPAIFPYDAAFRPIEEDYLSPLFRHLWSFRTNLSNSKMFGGRTKVQSGLQWYEYGRLTHTKLRTPLSITFAFVATHNHFVLDCGGKVFKQSAPIIKLPAEATEDDHLALLGLLNSSTACFWMKQVFFPKGGDHVGTEGARVRRTQWDERYEFAGTQLQNFPVTEQKPLPLSRLLDDTGRQLGELAPALILGRWSRGDDLKTLIEDAEAKSVHLRGLMIALQEELDWECYHLYGLVAEALRHSGDDLPELTLGQRPFEFVMARQMAGAELETTWFERHGSIPITEIPTHWPVAYRSLVERRIKLIETNKEIGLIERPEYKRRWNTEPWADQERRALKGWLLDRLEDGRYWPGLELQSTARLADRASGDSEFLEVAALYRGRPDFDVAALVAELVEAESVPFLPVLRYKATGLRKRAVWERTWDFQRREDAGEDVGDIPVPPKYATADFLKTDSWRLRGKLDVPKERWVSYPHCQTDGDPSLVVGWAGWDHLQQVEALVGYYDLRKREGWDARRLTPLLAGLDQLLPWVHQWHPQVVEEFGESAGRSYQTLLEQDAHELGLTLENIRNWTPPETARKIRAARKKKGQAEPDE